MLPQWISTAHRLPQLMCSVSFSKVMVRSASLMAFHVQCFFGVLKVRDAS